jgi:hypothetical protein
LPVTLATQEAEIRRIEAQSQPRQISTSETYLKKLITKKEGLLGYCKINTYIHTLVQTRSIPHEGKDVKG